MKQQLTWANRSLCAGPDNPDGFIVCVTDLRTQPPTIGYHNYIDYETMWRFLSSHFQDQNGECSDVCKIEILEYRKTEEFERLLDGEKIDCHIWRKYKQENLKKNEL